MATAAKKTSTRTSTPEPESTAPNSADAALQAQLAALQAQLAAAQAEAAAAKIAAAAATSANHHSSSHVVGATHYVGIRNISNYAIDLPASPLGTEGGVQLVPDSAMPDPRQRAVVSYAWWRQLRTSNLYRNGMIVRDDSVLGEGHQPAPADEPAELPAEARLNQVPDVGRFFVEHDERELRDRINQITSEQTIRRLQFAIDQEVKRIQDAIPEDPNNPSARAEQALREMPGKLVKAEQMLADRWLVLTAKYREA